MDEIYAYAWSSNQVDETKSTRLLRFRQLLGEDARTFRSEQKMEWSSWRSSTVKFILRFFWIDAKPIEFEWNMFPGLTLLENLQKTPKDLQNQNSEPGHFEERSIFMSMFNDIDGTRRRNSEKCISNSEQVKNCAKRFSRGHWTFPGPGDERKRYGTLSYTPEGKWDSIATELVGHLKETVHPVFKSISALSCGILKRKGGRDTIHINADSSNRTLVSHNLLSKSGQYLRSSYKVVWRVRSSDSGSKRANFGKVRSKRERAATEKCKAARSEFFGANYWVR